MAYILHRERRPVMVIDSYSTPSIGEHITDDQGTSDIVYAVNHVLERHNASLFPPRSRAETHVYARGEFKMTPKGDDR